MGENNMEENQELGMGMFQDIDIPGDELNLDDAPEEIKKLLSQDNDDLEGENDTTGDDDTSENNLNEDNQDDSSEGVVEEEDNEEGDSQDDSPNIYSSFAEFLVERGLLPSLNLEENKIQDDTSLAEAIKLESQNAAKEYIISKVGEKGYEALEKGISLLEYEQHTNSIKTLESLSPDRLEEDLELSKNIILEDLVNQGISKDRALKILKKTIDLGEETIVEDAKEALQSLKVFEAERINKLAEQRELEKQNYLKEQEKIDNDLKNTIYTSKEIIKGIQVNKEIQDKVYQSITKVVGQSPDGIMENKLMKDRRENPIEFDTKLYYLYELTNGFKDFSKLISKSESKAVSKLEQTLRQTNFKQQGGNPSFLEDPNSYGGSEFGSELVL